MRCTKCFWIDYYFKIPSDPWNLGICWYIPRGIGGPWAKYMINIRKYYLDFNEEWKPTSDGIAMPLDFDNSRELFSGLVEILSLAESKSVIEEHFLDLIKDLYNSS